MRFLLFPARRIFLPSMIHCRTVVIVLVSHLYLSDSHAPLNVPSTLAYSILISLTAAFYLNIIADFILSFKC